MIIAQVACGEHFDFKKSINRDLRRPPEKPPADGPCEISFQGANLYDSVKGGPHQSPSGSSCMFVVYTTTQAYPRFLIDLR